jgi:uncharacterized metal-binding protein YceD (DUF177 family)
MVPPCPSPELSRIVAVDRIGSEPVVEEIEATPAEAEALARRFDLIRIDSLKALGRLSRVRGGSVIRLEARIEASLVQRCVVTLAEVPGRIDERFVLFYAPETEPRHELVLSPDEESENEGEAEPLVAGMIDVGEAVAQQLALALDPYPRAPGASLTDVWSGGETPIPQPFAVLAQLKKVTTT